MKCAIIDCVNEAEGGWLACDSLHGKMLKIIIHTLRQYVSPNIVEKDILSEWKWFISDHPPTVEHALHYGKFVK